LGGALADRWPKKPLLVVTQIALVAVSLVLAALVYFAWPAPLWQLAALTALGGAVQAIDFPARLAFVVELVGRDDLMNAVALNSMLFNIARALGPAAAGWLLVTFSPAVCILVNGLSYLALVLALSRMRFVVQVGHAAPTTGQRTLGHGFRYLFANPGIALLIGLAGAMAMCGWPFLSFLPALAENQLGLDAHGFSAMLSATGVGALAAALTAASFGSMTRWRLFLAAGIGVAGAALIGLSLANTLVLAMICTAGVGYGLILFLVTCQGVVQVSADDAMRGRVMGIWAMALKAGSPVGNLLGGTFARVLGEPAVLRVQAVACGVTLAIVLVIQRLRKSPGRGESEAGKS
jgi:predicted MFS family arabinose efflux permease